MYSFIEASEPKVMLTQAGHVSESSSFVGSGTAFLWFGQCLLI